MAEIRAGDLLAGKYRVERVLGQGGMGFVVACMHIHLEQMVALKFIRHGALESEEAVLRFLREARAAVRLKSEHVARVFDVGTLESGEPYMVMEYLEGQDLHMVSKRGQLPIEEACEYVMQACEALAEAHSLGIIHRDIKPANLFLTRGRGGVPNIKVLDFGISRVASVSDTTDLEVTGANAMLGSPRFMSPEQMISPSEVDGRTDVWSLGIILYKLLSGALPFDSATLGALFNKVINDPLRPIRELRDDLPHALISVIENCMEKNREKRYGVAELAMALAPFAPARAKVSLDRIAEYVQLPEEEEAETAVAKSAEPSGSAHKSKPILVPAVHVAQPVMQASSPSTGTAAPWATRSSAPRATPPSRGPLMVLVAGVAGIVIIGASAALVGDKGSGTQTPPLPQPAIEAVAPVPITPQAPTAPMPMLTMQTGTPLETPAVDPRTLPLAPPKTETTDPPVAKNPGWKRPAPPRGTVVPPKRPPPHAPDAVPVPHTLPNGIPSEREP